MMTAYETLLRRFPNIRQKEPLARLTTFKIGGPADLYLEVDTTEDLLSVAAEARKLHVPVYLFGGGSNVLIGDKGIRGLVIKNNTRRITIKGMKGEVQAGESRKIVYVEADSGVSMNRLVRFTIDEGLQGLEMHLGLPGSVGGALYMNAKWTHPEGYVGDVVYQADLVMPDGKREIVPQSYFRFAYDTSVIQGTGSIVLRVVFALASSSKEALWSIANDSIAYRRQSQPQGIFSAGCTFRNITKAEAITLNTPQHTTSAGYLVDHAGLKGATIGDAQISQQHANFIVNRGKATATDVVQLIDRAKEQVKKNFGVELQEEIERIGEF